MSRAQVSRNVVNWFLDNQRDLPWRKTSDPYKIWVSEIMLQQTQVSTVIDYYNRFIDRLPTLEQLADVDIDILLKLWEGLGYYSRARNMKKAAIKIVSEFNGVFPKTHASLLSLPGIGPYTTGAIMSIAYNKPFSAVDGNVYRVMARYLGIKKSIKDKDVKASIQETVQSFMPLDHPRLYTEGLMELGATICIPSNPLCAICPLVDSCLAYQKGLTKTIPLKQKRAQKKEQHITIIAFIHNDHIAILKRQEGLLHGLYTFETIDASLTTADIKKRYEHTDIISIKKLPNYTHLFTHIKWYIRPYIVTTTHPLENLKYVSLNALKESYSLPKAYHTILTSIKKNQAEA